METNASDLCDVIDGPDHQLIQFHEELGIAHLRLTPDGAFTVLKVVTIAAPMMRAYTV